jgi:hypothetical protein
MPFHVIKRQRVEGRISTRVLVWSGTRQDWVGRRVLGGYFQKDIALSSPIFAVAAYERADYGQRGGLVAPVSQPRIESENSQGGRRGPLDMPLDGLKAGHPLCILETERVVFD